MAEENKRTIGLRVVIIDDSTWEKIEALGRSLGLTVEETISASLSMLEKHQQERGKTDGGRERRPKY